MSGTPPRGLADALGILEIDRDPEAWAFVLTAMGSECMRIAFAITGDAGLADDVVQETLLQVRDDAGQFRARSADPNADARGWIARICTHTALQLLRQRSRSQAREQRHVVENSLAVVATSEEMYMEREDHQLLRQAVARLPEQQRAAIVLLHFLDREYAEVAAELRIPIGTAKIRVHRGIERLRGILARQNITLAPVAIAGALTKLPHAGAEAVSEYTMPILPQHLHLLNAPRHATLHLAHQGIHMSTFVAISCAITMSCALGAVIVVAHPIHASTTNADAIVAAIAPPIASTPAMPARASMPTATNSQPEPITVDFSHATALEAYFGLHFRIRGGMYVPPATATVLPPSISCVIKESSPDVALAIVAEASHTHLEQRADCTWILPGLLASTSALPARLVPSGETPEPTQLSPGKQADQSLRSDLRWLNGNGVSRCNLLRTILPLVNASVVVDPDALAHDQDVIVKLTQGTFAELLHELGVTGCWRGKVLHLTLEAPPADTGHPATSPIPPTAPVPHGSGF